MNVLLVEDNPADVDLVRELLPAEIAGVEVAVAGDGVDAVDYLRRLGRFHGVPRPDLVLLDLNLPRKDGRHVLAEIESDEALREIPVVVLTSSEAESDIVSSYRLGANCYITKPVDLPGFRTVMREIGVFWFGTVRLPPQ